MSQHMRNRVISREHYEKLHEGMKRAARVWNWTVIDNPDPKDSKLITLVMLGLEHPPQQQESPDVHPEFKPAATGILEPPDAGNDDEDDDEDDEDDEDDGIGGLEHPPQQQESPDVHPEFKPVIDIDFDDETDITATATGILEPPDAGNDEDDEDDDEDDGIDSPNE